MALRIMRNTTLQVYYSHNSHSHGLMTQIQYINMLESSYSVSLLMAFMGVVSNIINIRVFVAMGINDGVTVSFLALAMFDLTYLVSALMLSVSTAFYVVELKLTTRFPIDPFAIFIFSANVMIIINISNILTTTFLAVVRCLCVARPLQFKNTITKERAILFMAGIAIFSATIYMPILANMGMANKFDKYSNTSRLSLWMSPYREVVKNIVWVVIDVILPIVTQFVILVCIIIMARCLRTASKFRQSSERAKTIIDKGNNKQDCDQIKRITSDANSSTDKLTGKDLRVVQQVVLISVVYIVCNVPKILISFCTIIEPEFRVGKRYTNVYLSVHFIRKYFEIINAAVNFIVYYKYNAKFRSVLSI